MNATLKFDQMYGPLFSKCRNIYKMKYTACTGVCMHVYDCTFALT